MRYTVDLAGLDSRGALHERLRAALPLPEYYGNNLDALYDTLSELPPFELTWQNSAQAQADMHGYLAALRRLCGRLAAERPDITILWEETEQ